MHTRSLLALAATTALLLSGCGAVDGDTGADGQGDADLTVAAGFYPLAWVASRVGGEGVDVTNLTTAGQDPHDVELSISQTAQIAAADLVLLTEDLQASVAASAEQNATGLVVDTAELVELRPVTRHDHEHGEDEHADEHADEHGEDEHGEDEHADEHGHGDRDPHFWLDPLLMRQIGEAVADRLAELDSDNAQQYVQNAEQLGAELESLDQEYVDGLAQCSRDTVVVSHDAFGYLSRYGLHFEPIAGLSPGAEPTPAHLQRLQRLIASEGVTTVFTETLASPAMADSLADDLDLRTAVLDPVEGLTDESGEEDYLSLMRANLSALQQANGC